MLLEVRAADLLPNMPGIIEVYYIWFIPLYKCVYSPLSLSLYTVHVTPY